MKIILVTGGARSGKSEYAEARASEIGGSDVTYIATAVNTDEEMERRIAKHRAARPAGWSTVEASRQAGEAVANATTHVVLLDCLTCLASNALIAAVDRNPHETSALAAVMTEVESVISAAGVRDGTLIIVTNEVGLGVVPATRLGRWYRDALGSANRRVAGLAEDVILMVSGVPVSIKAAASK